MKIAFNPSTVAALIAPPNNKDITFDLRGQNIFARGVKFCGTDTNTWRDIKINNVSIDSNILDLRDGDNTTLTNINGIVTINSTWRPVVDNLTSDSTTSSLSANQGRVLVGLINDKSDSGHNHDDRYLRLTGGTMQLGEGLKFHADENYFGTHSDARIISLLDGNNTVCDGGLIIDERATLNGTKYVTELLRIRDSEFKWRGSNILHSGNSNINGNTITINGSSLTVSKSDHIHSNYVTDLGTNGNYLTWTKNGSTNNITVPYATTSSYLTNGFSAPWVGKWDCNAPDRVVYSDYGSNGRLIANAPSEWQYGTLLELGHTNYRGINGNLNIQLMWDVAHNTTLPGTLWFRGKDYVNGWAKSWAKVITDQNISSILSNYYTESEVNNLLSKKLNTSDFNWTNLPGKLVKGNEFNIVNAGFNNRMWFNYLPINDRSKTATITGYSFGNGAQGYATITASGFIKNGSSSSYVLLGDGGVAAFNWSGQSGQPTWLWGGNNQHSYYVYNPSNFRVAYATSSGNADTVDGYHANSFLIDRGGNYSGLIYDLSCKSIFSGNNLNDAPTTGWVSGIVLGSNWNSSHYQHYLVESGTRWYATRVYSNGKMTNWNTFAYLTDNVASATKLQTARTIWGQSFDGTRDVNGTIYINNSNSSNGAIRLNNNIDSNARISAIDSQVIFNTGAAIRFGGTSWDWNVWAGLKYTHSNKTIYLGIADNSIFNANSDQSGGSLRFPGISNVYATTFNGSLSGNASTATNADTVDGYHANGLLTALSNSNNGISITVGGTTKSVSNISVNYANSAGNADTATNAYHLRINSANTWSTWYWAGQSGQPSWLWGSNDGTNMYVWDPNNFNVHTAQYLRSLGNQNCQTGRTQNYGDVYTYNTVYYNTGAPIGYTSVIGFGRGIDGTVEIAGGWCNTGLFWRSLRNCCDDWYSWRTVLDSSNYTGFIDNYYWANVKISTSSSTTTSPTVSNLTATNSIKMGNILLEHTDEINNSANGSLHLNYRNSGNITLCIGGGNVGISNSSPSYKLDVNGQVRASGFHHGSVDSNNYILLAGGGYKSFGGSASDPIFLGYLSLEHGNDGTISSSFYCLGYSVPFTYTRGGNYCRIHIPDTTHQTFYIRAAIASVNYSGGGMDTWVGYHRGAGSLWLHCYASGLNEVRVKGFCQRDSHNDSWWGGNPLWPGNDGANRITVCIFGNVILR